MVIRISKVNIESMLSILDGIKSDGHEFVSMTIEENPDNHTIHIHPVVFLEDEEFNPSVI